MSNDSNIQDQYRYGGHNSSTATNIGSNQASNNQTSAAQQHNETTALYQQRQAAYDAERKRQR